ncbi:hypothetical protein J6590_102724, partial [Homalodisca vitripennis]
MRAILNQPTRINATGASLLDNVCTDVQSNIRCELTFNGLSNHHSQIFYLTKCLRVEKVISRQLRDPQTLRATYCAHVRPLLLSGPLMKIILGKSLSAASADLERALNLNSLEETRDVHAIDSPFLLELVTFRCHGRTRSMVLFARRHHNCFLEANCTMERFQQLGNPISNYLDSFHALLTSLKLLLHGS